ncbi:MAG: hypothetical protein GVY36_04460 [Verrucomicrobia bacterium]|jgi:Cu2+-exporting ATPase|nr:hypothetical protein [Verrucomicrobiota bacterium]
MPTATQATCTHCGTPFTPRAEEAYCCHGCEYVAQILQDNDLTRFYELKGKTTVPPIGAKAFADVEVAPLVGEIERMEQSGTAPVVTSQFNIEGISCIGCVWLVEAIFQRQTGGVRIRIDPRSSTVEIHWQRGHFNVAEFAQELQRIGYRLTRYSEDSKSASKSGQLTHRLGLCGFFLMNTMLFTLPKYLGMEDDFFLARLFHLLAASFATLSLCIGGGYFIQRAWRAIQNRVLHIDLPIAAGLLAGYTGSLLGWITGYLPLVYFDFVATFVFLMLLGRWLQEYALEKNRTHLQRQKAGPGNVALVGGARDGQTIPASEVEAKAWFTVSLPARSIRWPPIPWSRKAASVWNGSTARPTRSPGLQIERHQPGLSMSASMVSASGRAKPGPKASSRSFCKDPKTTFRRHACKPF